MVTAFAYLTTEVSFPDAPARSCRRRCADRPGFGARLGLARGRARADGVLVRSRAPVRRRPASRNRHRGRNRGSGRGARLGDDLLRRQRPGRRQDRHDPNARRLLGDARPPRLLRSAARGGRRRGGNRRHCRAERRPRARRPLRVSRNPKDRRGAGIPRPAALPPCLGLRFGRAARRCRRRRSPANAQAGSCGCAGRGLGRARPDLRRAGRAGACAGEWSPGAPTAARERSRRAGARPVTGGAPPPGHGPRRNPRSARPGEAACGDGCR